MLSIYLLNPLILLFFLKKIKNPITWHVCPFNSPLVTVHFSNLLQPHYIIFVLLLFYYFFRSTGTYFIHFAAVITFNTIRDCPVINFHHLTAFLTFCYLSCHLNAFVYSALYDCPFIAESLLTYSPDKDLNAQASKPSRNQIPTKAALSSIQV